MKRGAMPCLLMVGWLACGAAGCQHATAPLWDVSRLSNGAEERQDISWTESAHNGAVNRWQRDLILCRRTVHGVGHGISVSATVTVFRNTKDSIARYIDWSDWDSYGFDRQVYKSGTVSGLRYTISRSSRPRVDPEGGGGLMDRRDTHLVLCKNVTVVTATIYSEGADRQVNVTEVFKSINSLVKDW